MLNWITERIWPRLTGPEPSCPKPKCFIRDNNQVALSEVAQIVSHRLEQSKQRQKTVETKLISLFTLTSVLSVVITAALTAVATIGTIDEEIKIYIFGSALLIGYIAIQIARALWCTISGLTRRKYTQLSSSQITPKCGEIQQNYQIRLYNLVLNQISQHDWVVDRNVEEMAVAHVAIKNAILATYVLILLTLLILLVRIF